MADVLWFATGGGETEAYLGLAAYVLTLRRLQKELKAVQGITGLRF